MLLSLHDDHKEHLNLLIEQSPQGKLEFLRQFKTILSDFSILFCSAHWFLQISDRLSSEWAKFESICERRS